MARSSDNENAMRAAGHADDMSARSSLLPVHAGRKAQRIIGDDDDDDDEGISCSVLSERDRRRGVRSKAPISLSFDERVSVRQWRFERAIKTVAGPRRPDGAISLSLCLSSGQDRYDTP